MTKEALDARSSGNERAKAPARTTLFTLLDIERERTLHQLGPWPIRAAMRQRARVIAGVGVRTFALALVGSGGTTSERN